MPASKTHDLGAVPKPDERPVPVRAVPAAVAQRAVRAPGFVRAVHPEHGQPVLYMPGEMLPGWLIDKLRDGTAQLVAAADAEGVLDVEQQRLSRARA